MEVGEVHGLVDGVDAVDATADRVAVEAALGQARRLIAWCQAREAALARQLAGMVAFVEPVLAEASRSTIRQAATVLDRAATVAAMPAFATAFDAGRVGGEHVDIASRAMRSLTDIQQQEFTRRAATLTVWAEETAPDEFARLVRREVHTIRAETGLDRLARQRADCRLRTWTDRSSGMWHLAGRFDPERGLILHNQLQAVIAALFAERVPDNAPPDPGERNDHLRALALHHLATTTGHTTRRAGRAEITVVIDTRHSPHADPDTGDAGEGSGSRIDWGIPVELPAELVSEIAARPGTDTTAVVLRDGVVVHAAGEINLGRSTRLASRAQRRALRALHPTCMIPDCPVRFENCTIHHIGWWRHGGRTDLANMGPVCSRHHRAIHDWGWQIDIAPDRTITVTLPDGTQLPRPPPKPTAA